MTVRIDREAELAKLEKLATLLDAKFETPIGVRVGWDGIIGLVPVVGGIATTLVSGYLIARAAVLGATTPVLLRMGLNVGVDAAISLVPFFGWIGDFFWKSNLRNTRVLRGHLTDPSGTRRRSTWVLISVVAVVVMAVATFALLVAVIAWMIAVLIYGSFS